MASRDNVPRHFLTRPNTWNASLRHGRWTSTHAVFPQVTVGIPAASASTLALSQTFRATKQSAGILLQSPSPPSALPKYTERITALRKSPTKSSATNFSDASNAGIAQPSALSEAVSGAATDGVSVGVEAVTPQSGGDKIGSTGVDSVYFRADESKDIDAAEYAEDAADGSGAVAGAVAEAANVAVEAAQTGLSPAAPEHLAQAAIEAAHDGDEEEGGKRISTASGERVDRAGNIACEPSNVDSSSPPSLMSDKIDTIRGGGEDNAGEPEGGGVPEEERAAGHAAVVDVAAVDGIGPHESLRSTETVSDNAVAVAAAAAAATPVAAPRGRAAGHLRPSPIVTKEISPVFQASSPEMTGQADNGDDNTGDADASGQADPETVRQCFVAKTFSPSDLGLGEMQPVEDGGDGGADQEAMTKESLKARRRRKTIHKGITSIEGRRHTVDEVLGLDDPQAVLGSVPPERLFSLTGMFHPEAPVKV